MGIIPESELTGTTSVPELEKIIYDALTLGPMLEPLIEDLVYKDHVDKFTKEVSEKEVVKALYSCSFLSQCP